MKLNTGYMWVWRWRWITRGSRRFRQKYKVQVRKATITRWTYTWRIRWITVGWRWVMRGSRRVRVPIRKQQKIKVRRPAKNLKKPGKVTVRPGYMWVWRWRWIKNKGAQDAGRRRVRYRI